MKILHCADLHLDSKMETLSPEKSKIRRGEILDTFERIVKYAVNNGVRVVIIAGDMFDTDRVTKKTRERVLGTITDAKSVDFLYLTGNHDDKSFLLETELPANFKVFGRSWTSFKYGNVNVCGTVTDRLNADSFYDGLELSEKDFNIVVLHGQVAGYKSKNHAEIISLPRLKDRNIDDLALGHVHEFVSGKLDERGIYAYSGCPEGRGFDETGVKGFVLLDTDGKRADIKFVPFSKRELIEEIFSVEGETSFYDTAKKIVGILSEKYSPGSLVKVILKGGHDTGYAVDKEVLKKLLSEVFFFAKVYDRTELIINKNDYETDKSVRGEFIRAVMESDMENLTKSRVIMCGINALKGEEI